MINNLEDEYKKATGKDAYNHNTNSYNTLYVVWVQNILYSVINSIPNFNIQIYIDKLTNSNNIKTRING